jgi:hypothetical protein
MRAHEFITEGIKNGWGDQIILNLPNNMGKIISDNKNIDINKLCPELDQILTIVLSRYGTVPDKSLYDELTKLKITEYCKADKISTISVYDGHTTTGMIARYIS